ncbi:hypothetical protein P7C70_g2343, partial [Phenoliferia sp. Uapishka_3]
MVEEFIAKALPSIYILSELKGKENAPVPYAWNADYRQVLSKPIVTGKSAKWGVALGVAMNLPVAEEFTTLDGPLCGRMAAADIIVRLGNSAGDEGVKMRVVGIYAPHSDSPDVKEFWIALADFLSPEKGCPERWLIAGDTNATLEPCESTNPAWAPNAACKAYSRFLQSTGGTDAWVNKENCSVLQDWTHRPYQHPNSLSVLDRVASSLPGEEFTVCTKGYVPRTDHRPIWCDILTPVKLPNTTPGSIPRPSPRRLRLPKWGDKLQGPLYAKRVDEEIQAAGLEDLDVGIDEVFDKVYDGLTEIFRKVGEEVFGVRGPRPKKRKYISPAIKRLDDDLYHWNCYIGAMKRSTAEHNAVETFVNRVKNAKFAKKIHGKVQRATPPTSSFEQALAIASGLRRLVCRAITLLKQMEAAKQAAARDEFKLKDVNRGGSVKRLLMPRCHMVQPTVVIDEATGEITAKPSEVRNKKRDYWSGLYEKEPLDDSPKPWMHCDAAKGFQEGAAADPFIWPPTNLDLTRYRYILTRGNRRPSPGPDGWEKWCLALLSDRALGLPLKLLKRIVNDNYHSKQLQQTFLLPLYKRGLFTSLSNYRCVAFSQRLENDAATLFTLDLQEYSERRGLIPPEQTAGQKGLQLRDMLSLLAQVDTSCKRQGITVYTLFRDQMKGFDMLRPEAAEDAYKFFGIGEAASKFDRMRLASTDFIIKSVYGLVRAFTKEGQMKQGDPPSPTKFSLTGAMAMFWIKGLLKDCGVKLRTLSAKAGLFHTPADKLELNLQSVAVMDDTIILATSPADLGKVCGLFEKFQKPYGAKTGWGSKCTATIIGKQPKRPPPGLVMPSEDGPQIVNIVKEFYLGRTWINDPKKRFQDCLAVVANCVIPAMETRKLPISSVIKVVEQKIIWVLRAKMTLQPLRQDDADKLDGAITSRIQKYMGWVYPVEGHFLSLPLKNQGFGLTSPARINQELLLEGVRRDLNHHLAPYRIMAQITYADMECGYNGCRSPFSAPYLGVHGNSNAAKDFPQAWTEAVKLLKTTNFSIQQTDQGFIGRGDVGLNHLLWSRETKGDVQHALKSFGDLGFKTLAEISQGPVTPSRFLLIPHIGTALARNILTKLLHNKSLYRFATGEYELLYSADERRAAFEHIYRSDIRARMRLDSTKSQYVLACDGSAYGTQSATGAVVGPLNVCFRVPPQYSNSMTGELTAAIGAALVDDVLRSLKPEQLPQRQTTILTDYLNVVRVTDGRETPLRPAPLVAVGGPYNRWLHAIAGSQPHIRYVHVKAHTGCEDVASELNDAADRLAKRAHALPDFTIEYPTFTLPTWALHDGKRWVEGTFSAAAETLVTDHVLKKMKDKTRGTMNSMQNIRFPPPTYLYRIATSTYAAQIQTLIRTHSLPTGARDGARLRGHLHTCAHCHELWEDEAHIFEHCNAGLLLKMKAVEEIRTSTFNSLEITAPNLGEGNLGKILAWAASLPYASGYWWLYPLQMLPQVVRDLPEKSQKRLHNDWHRNLIQLTGRLYAQRSRGRAGWGKKA